MHPVKTDRADFVYRGPTENIGDLWVERDLLSGVVRTTYDFTDGERAEIAAGGRLELAIFTMPIPPIAMCVLNKEDSEPVDDHPFKIHPDEPERTLREKGRVS